MEHQQCTFPDGDKADCKPWRWSEPLNTCRALEFTQQQGDPEQFPEMSPLHRVALQPPLLSPSSSLFAVAVSLTDWFAGITKVIGFTNTLGYQNSTKGGQ